MSDLARDYKLYSYMNDSAAGSDHNETYCAQNVTEFGKTSSIDSLISDYGMSCCSSGRSMCMAEPSSLPSGQPTMQPTEVSLPPLTWMFCPGGDTLYGNSTASTYCSGFNSTLLTVYNLTSISTSQQCSVVTVSYTHLRAHETS